MLVKRKPVLYFLGLIVLFVIGSVVLALFLSNSHTVPSTNHVESSTLISPTHQILPPNAAVVPSTPTWAFLTIEPTEPLTPSVTTVPIPHVHVVQDGETLSEIAEQFSVSLVALKEANGLIDDLIHAGDLLTIPITDSHDDASDWGLAAQENTQIHIVQAGQVLGQIAEIYGVSVDALVAANALQNSHCLLYTSPSPTRPY